MASRADLLLRGLLKFLVDVDVSSDSNVHDGLKQTLMNDAAVCIKLLDCCCHGNLQVSSPEQQLSEHLSETQCQCLCLSPSLSLVSRRLMVAAAALMSSVALQQ